MVIYGAAKTEIMGFSAKKEESWYFATNDRKNPDGGNGDHFGRHCALLFSKIDLHPIRLTYLIRLQY